MRSLLIGCVLAMFLLPMSGEIYAKKKEDSKKVPKKESAYEKLFKGHKKETVKGMFTVHKMNEKVYFEIPLNLMGRDMLLGSTISEINDSGDAFVGEKPFDPLHVKFVKHDSTVQLRQITALNFVVDEQWEGVKKALQANAMPSILQVFKIEAYTPDSSAVVVDMTPLFIEEYKQMEPFSTMGDNAFLGLATRTSKFLEDLSCLNEIKAFEDNVSVKSTLNYVSDIKLLGLLLWKKQKPTTAKLTRTFLLLPEEPMRPRISDPRIGIFFTGNEQFSADYDQAKGIYFTNRWRLEPVDEEAYKRGELVEPKKPIIFYVDNNFPEEWKAAIKEGVLEWNAVFEKIGFKNVMRALDFPKDDPEFDPDNLKYSCVRYAPTWTTNAMGPSWTDPRSGEIICAGVYLYHNMIKLVNNWRFVQTAQVDPSVRNRTLPEDIRHESMRYVVAHEIGHCLGLMHNMCASAAVPVDSLRSKTFTQKYGTTYSIMDYARFNYVAQPEDKGVKLTPPHLGIYDEYVIKWLYTPLFVSPKEEQKILNQWISEKAGDPIYRYGKQQIYATYDPTSLTEDLGDDAIKASEYGIKNLKYIMKNLNNWFADQDPDYSHREGLYSQIISQYKRYLNHVMVSIGGIYLYEKQAGDPYPTYQSVPKAKQKAALQFILKEIKDMSWLEEDKELLKMISLKKSTLTDMQIGKSSIFNTLLSAKKKNGILLSSERSEDPYTLKEYLDDIYQYVWGCTMNGKNPTLAEKANQTYFITHLYADIDPNVKADKIFLTDPEKARQGKLTLLDKIYAPSLDEAILFNLDESGMLEKHKDLIEQAVEAIGSEPISGFSYLREIKPDEVQNTKALYFNYLMKIKSLLEKNQNVGSQETRDHYRHLLYKINKTLDVK